MLRFRGSCKTKCKQEKHVITAQSTGGYTDGEREEAAVKEVKPEMGDKAEDRSLKSSVQPGR